MKRKMFFTGLTLLFVLTVLVCAIYPDPDAVRTDVPPSSQDDYPVLDEPNVNATIFPMRFDVLNKQSSLVVRGTVAEQLPSQTVTTEFEPVTDEEGNITHQPPDLSMEVRYFRIKVTDVIRGSAPDEIIVGRNEIYDESAPAMNEGDDMIWFLYTFEDAGYYALTSFQNSYYYVAGDNRVYPARLEEATRAYSGMGLSEFKKEIRSYRYEAPKLIG
mgnify:FL=1